MDNNVSRSIDRILEVRRQRLPIIEAQITKVENSREAAKHITAIKNSIIDSNGKLLTNSPYYVLFADSPEMLTGLQTFSAEQFLKESEILLGMYQELRKRFSRDYINIAVVGPARQGKSQFLQAVSGLDDRCIPAFTGGHCTGASSIIQNSDQEGVVAEITFKTEVEIINEVQGYLDIITNKQYRISGFRDIPKINKQEIERIISKLNKSNVAITDGMMDTLFNRFVYHFDEWKEYIGSQPMTIVDEDEIMTFVAQRNKSETEHYFRFVAVKNALIKKAFNYEDTGKIRMIDTEGLGAVTTDTESNMFKTISSESDAVIFFKRTVPNDLSTPTIQELDIFDRIRNQFKERQTEKWFAFLINHTGNSSPFGDNYKGCKNYCEYIESHKTVPTMMNSIIDVHDRDEVIGSFLVPFLNGLIANLDDLDDMFFRETVEQAQRTMDAYEMLCENLNSISKKRFSSSNNVFYTYQLIENTIEKNLITKIRDLNREFGAQRTEECEILSSQINSIIDNMMDMIPEKEEIDSLFNARGGMQPSDIYIFFLDKIRNKLTKQFIQVDVSLDNLTCQFKNRIADCLLSEEGGNLGKIADLSENSQPYEALLHFARRKMEPEDYPQIRSAIEFVCDFQFSVRGFLMSKIRSNLYDISRANPNILSGLDFIPSNGKWGKTIWFNLVDNVQEIHDKLKKELRQFFVSPNEAYFAVSDEFYDRIYYSEGVKEEWMKLYSSYVMQLYSKELMANAANSQIAQRWIEDIETIEQYNKADSFIIVNKILT